MTLQEHSTKFRKGQVVGDSEGQESTLQIGQRVFSISLHVSYFVLCLARFTKGD